VLNLLLQHRHCTQRDAHKVDLTEAVSLTGAG
jgi:hypothetical protein